MSCRWNRLTVRIIDKSTELLGHRENARIGPKIDLIRLSPVPVDAQISPHAHKFCASLRRIADVPDSLAGEEGV